MVKGPFSANLFAKQKSFNLPQMFSFEQFFFVILKPFYLKSLALSLKTDQFLKKLKIYN